jgi:GH24 family phage-related lysozyme (muramidase)
MLALSQNYCNELTKLEGIEGQVPGNPGQYSWYYDDIGVATLGNGHALTDPHGQHIRRGQPAANALAEAAVLALGFGSTLSAVEIATLKTRDMAAFAVPVAAMVRGDTNQAQFDALVDFAYNVGVGALKSSSLLRMHNSATVSDGPADLAALAKASQSKAPILNIGQAFAAWSNADHTWNHGVFHRRMWEFLIYGGMDYAKAYSTAFAF